MVVVDKAQCVVVFSLRGVHRMSVCLRNLDSLWEGMGFVLGAAV